MSNQSTSDAELSCYRCGGSLAGLSLPLSRLDLCPHCGVHLHVCRMCSHYAPRLPEACDEDDAEEVRDKQTANFCDYFKPDPHVFDGRERQADQHARQALDALFGQSGAPAERDSNAASGDSDRQAAEDLFSK